MLLVHHLGIDRQARAARSFHENIERFDIALKRVGIGPRLPHPPAQRVRPGLLDRRRGLVEIIRILRVDRALAGDDQQLLAQRHAADFDAVAGEIRPLVHQFERRLDAVDAVDVIQPFQPVDHQLLALVAEDGVDRAHRADDRLNIAAELRHDGGDFGELLRGQAIGLRDDHGVEANW